LNKFNKIVTCNIIADKLLRNPEKLMLASWGLGLIKNHHRNAAKYNHRSDEKM